MLDYCKSGTKNDREYPALMLHVNGGSLTKEQFEKARDFSKSFGRKVSINIEGTHAYPIDHARSQLSELNIEFLKRIPIKTGKNWWSIIFDPKSYQAAIFGTNDNVRRGRLFLPFPKRELVPEEERGKTSEERLICRFDKMISMENGGIPNGVLNQLAEHRSLFKIKGDLLTHFVTVRAERAGFDFWSDYLESHFFDIDPQKDRLELVCRKIFSPPFARPRFKAAGMDLDQIKVSPQDIVNLFGNHLHLLDHFTRNLSHVPCKTTSSRTNPQIRRERPV